MKTIRISALILTLSLFACSGDESEPANEPSSPSGANSSSSVSSSSETSSSSAPGTSSSSSSENSSSSATEASSSSEEASSSSAVDLGPVCASTTSASYCLTTDSFTGSKTCWRLGAGTVNTLEDCQGRSGDIVHREDCEKGWIKDGDCEPIDNPYCDPMMYCKGYYGLTGTPYCNRVGARSMINPSKCDTPPVARQDCPDNPDDRGDEECDKIDLGGGGLI